MIAAKLRAILNPIAIVIATAFVAFQVYATAGIGAVDSPLLRGFHLSAVMMLIFLWRFGAAKDNKDSVLKVILDIIMAVGAFAIAVYIWWQLPVIQTRMQYIDPLTNLDLFFGILAIFLTLEVTRRTAGWPLVLVAVAAIIYALFGQYLPEALSHRGSSLEELVELMFLVPDGIYGVPLGNACTIVFAFIVFGSLLAETNMSGLFMDLACFLTRNAKGGPAKAAVCGSAFFGTISGSAVANVYATGTFTIPLMKRAGYAPYFAGAVEAVASTGGQIMPPIMGAAAFIMADMSELGYLAVVKGAILPAILYYLALIFMVHFEACRRDLGGLPPEAIPDKRGIIRRLYQLLPIVILIVFLSSGRSVMQSAYLASVSILILSFFSKDTRLSLKGWMNLCVATAKNVLMVAACCACSGIVVGVLTLTGAGFSFMNAIMGLAGESLFILLVLLMITCMILGMGVPTAPAYIIVAALGAAGLIKVGVLPIAAHMFVLYFAVLSVITPPVCLASFAGAAVADADAMKTGFTALRLGIAAYIIPFMFVYEPALLLQGELSEIIPVCITSIIGIWALAGGSIGWLLVQANIVERAALCVGGVCMIYPGSMTDMLGIGLVGGVFIIQFIRKRVAKARHNS